MWSQFTNVTDGRTTCDRNTLCTKVHRAVKIVGHCQCRALCQCFRSQRWKLEKCQFLVKMHQIASQGSKLSRGWYPGFSSLGRMFSSISSYNERARSRSRPTAARCWRTVKLRTRSYSYTIRLSLNWEVNEFDAVQPIPDSHCSYRNVELIACVILRRWKWGRLMWRSFDEADVASHSTANGACRYHQLMAVWRRLQTHYNWSLG